MDENTLNIPSTITEIDYLRETGIHMLGHITLDSRILLHTIDVQYMLCPDQRDDVFEPRLMLFGRMHSNCKIYIRGVVGPERDGTYFNMSIICFYFNVCTEKKNLITK